MTKKVRVEVMLHGIEKSKSKKVLEKIEFEKAMKVQTLQNQLWIILKK